MQNKILTAIYIATGLLLITTLYLWSDILTLRGKNQAVATLKTEIQTANDNGAALRTERQQVLTELNQQLAALQKQLQTREATEKEAQPTYQQLLQDARQQVADEKGQENSSRTFYRADPVAVRERMAASIRAEFQYLLREIGLDDDKITEILDKLVEQAVATSELQVKKFTGEITDEEYQAAIQTAKDPQTLTAEYLTPDQSQKLEQIQQERRESQTRAYIESEIYRYAGSLSDDTRKLVIDGLTDIELAEFVARPPGIPGPDYFQRLYQGKIDALNDFENAMATQLNSAEFNILRAYLERQRRDYQLNLHLNGPKQ